MIKSKCKTCPYHLGIIKCVKSPCIECELHNRKTHPFQNKDKIIICTKCGSKIIKDGKCAVCGTKEK